MHVEVIWLLLERGVDLDIEDKDGQTPLEVAKSYENMEIIEWSVKSAKNIKLYTNRTLNRIRSLRLTAYSFIDKCK